MGFQVYSTSGQLIGCVEQSHGDILSDGSSCGTVAVLANCQQISAWWGGRRKPNKQGPGTIFISKQHNKHRENLRRDHRRPEMKRKARSNLFVVARTQFFRAARLKGRMAKRNEKGITSAAQIWRPLLEMELQYQLKQEENKANIVILCKMWDQVFLV